MSTVLRLVAAVTLAAVAMPLPAQDLGAARDRLGVSGSLRAGYWSSTRELDRIDPGFGGIAWLKATPSLGANASLFLEGWGALRGPTDDTHATGDLREAYLDLRAGRLDARIGRQVIAWGRADGINPTDNLTPRDQVMLVPDDADRRLGSTGVRASWYEGDVSFTAIWLAEFRPHRVPLPTGAGGPAFREPHERWPGETFALRAERTGGAVDWSISFMNGPDLLPDLAVEGPGVVRLDHRRIWVAGADGAMNVGRFGLRAEAAFTRTEDKGGDDPFVRNHHAFVVLGADRSFGDRLNVNLQYLSRYVVDHATRAPDTTFASSIAAFGTVIGSQVARSQHGASGRIKHSWRNETLAAELAGVAWFGPRGIVVAPKLTYAVSDHWSLLIGGEVYRGDARAALGVMRPNSVGFGEVRVGF